MKVWFGVELKRAITGPDGMKFDHKFLKSASGKSNGNNFPCKSYSGIFE